VRLALCHIKQAARSIITIVVVVIISIISIIVIIALPPALPVHLTQCPW
jgi:hypothetical protein